MPDSSQNTPNSLENLFRTQDRHSTKHEEHDQKLEEHTLQLQIQAQQIKALQENSIRLENVVMSESRETRTTITNTNQQLYDLINNLMGYKSGQSQLNNTLTMAKWESIAKIIGILAGSGGILYYIIT